MTLSLLERHAEQGGTLPPPLLLIVLDPGSRLGPPTPDSTFLVRTPKRPAWFLLYSLLPAAVLLFLLAELIPETNLWRAVTQSAILLVVLGAALAWVRGNRVHLLRSDEKADSGLAVRARVVYSPGPACGAHPIFPEASAPGLSATLWRTDPAHARRGENLPAP